MPRHEPIYTDGLKIRLHEQGLKRVLEPIEKYVDLKGAFDDVKIWVTFPNAVSSVAALVTAWLTRSWSQTIVVAAVGFMLCHLSQQFFYSHLLKTFFAPVSGGLVYRNSCSCTSVLPVVE